MIKKRIQLTLVFGLFLVSGVSQTALMKKEALLEYMLKEKDLKAALGIPMDNISAPERLGVLGVLVRDDKFSVLQENEVETNVTIHSVDKSLRERSHEDLIGFLVYNGLSVTQSSDGEFLIKERTRGLGGGLGLGVLCYVGTQAACWGTAGWLTKRFADKTDTKTALGAASDLYQITDYAQQAGVTPNSLPKEVNKLAMRAFHRCLKVDKGVSWL